MKSRNVWFVECLKLMGIDDVDKFLAEQTESGKKEVEKFLDFIGNIQQDAIGSNANYATNANVHNTNICECNKTRKCDNVEPISENIIT